MTNRWVVTLPLAGAAPFALAVWLNVQQVTLLGADAAAWLWGYSVVIAAFLAGAQWGRSLQLLDLVSLIASNGFALVIFALALWLGQIPASSCWRSSSPDCCSLIDDN